MKTNTKNTANKKLVSLQHVLANIYFFFNSVGLSGGLLYTNILSPYFIYKIYKQNLLYSFLKCSFLFFTISIFHFYFFEADAISLLISTTLVISTISFLYLVTNYINHNQTLDKLFLQILKFNFVLNLIALPFYFAPQPIKALFWYTNLFTTQKEFTRLSLFTFEASYYALIFTPLVFYFLCKIIVNKKIIKSYQIIIMLLLPLLLSFSFGVIGCIVIVILLLLLRNINVIISSKTYLKLLVGLSFILLIIGLIAIVFFSENLLVKRVFNIFEGSDTSANGRISESFQLGYLVAKTKSLWFGVGLGQPKLILPDIIRSQFQHWGHYQIYRIPNATAETLAMFGIVGLIIRFFVLAYLFFKTKVSSNYFRLSLFLFMFIYQFTGSFFTNVVEYVIWIFAFVNCFPEFDKQNDKQK